MKAVKQDLPEADAHSIYWEQLLKLRELCQQDAEHDLIGINLHEISFFKSDKLKLPLEHLLTSKRFDLLLSKRTFLIGQRASNALFNGKLHVLFAANLEPGIKNALSLYTPLAAAQWMDQDLPFVLVHMAQSLDGKVCTISGTSKWIGNQENLVHAHRIRALVDGVLVGANTARAEKPSLNVRHVSGPDPARIILCNSCDNLDALPDVDNMRNFLLCGPQNKTDVSANSLGLSHLQVLNFDEIDSPAGMAKCLKALKQEQVHSILVEGGPTTIKTFMQASAIDCLQLHIAPIVFGSGHAFVDLPEIAKVDQACQLRNVHYVQMGDAMMVTGEL